MDFDEDKIDEYTLALLYLVTYGRHEGLGARAWKGFDWDIRQNTDPIWLHQNEMWEYIDVPSDNHLFSGRKP